MRFLMIFLFAISLFAADFDWIDSMEKAKEQAFKENKLIMVMIEQKGCEACEYMDEVAFEDEKLVEFVENFYIPVKINLQKANKIGLKAFGTPTFYFLDKNGKKIGRQLVGAGTAKAFLQKLKEYKKIAQNQ